MENTKLTSLFKTFTPSEFKEFEKFLSSPFHSGDRNLKPLFEIVKKYYPKFDDPKFTKEETFRVLYPDEKFDEARIRKLMSFLLKMGEDYLVAIALRNDKYERNFLLLKEFRERELDTPYKGLANTMEKEISTTKFPVEIYFAKRLDYCRETFIYYYDYKYDYGKAFELVNEQLTNSTSLFLFFLFRALNTKSIAEKFHATDYDKTIHSAIRNTFEIEKFFNSEAKGNETIEIMLPGFYISKALEDIFDFESYEKGKKLLIENIGKYNTTSQHAFFRDLRSINIYREHYGETESIKQEAQKEIFEIIKLMFEYEAVIPDNEKYLPVNSFKIILNSALINKDYQWAEKFIEEYIPRLEPEQRKSMKYFALAFLEVKRGNYEKCLEYIINIKIDTPFIKFTVRHLNFIVFYELELYEEARYFLDTTQKYYSNTREIPSAVKEEGQNFVKYYKMLLRYSDKLQSEEIEMNFKKLLSEKVLTNKEWLLEKFEGIVNKTGGIATAH
ncbi:MAG: hypothetical protein KDC42_11395 [Ignavibacteriae bacterium]|nr:hypothetical protein [Ignavibacteriota bacterium]